MDSSATIHRLNVTRKLLFILIVLASLGTAGYALVAYAGWPAGATVHPQMRAVYAQHLPAVYIHVFGSCVTLLLGPFQFITAIRRSRPRLHRNMGRAYLALGVLPGGLAGVYMSTISYGGIISHTGFATLAFFWLITGWLAYSTARARDFAAHRRWMIRNFACALAAFTLRVGLGLGFASGIPFDQFYPWLAWTSWIPNLIVAEWLIRRRPAHPNPPTR